MPGGDRTPVAGKRHEGAGGRLGLWRPRVVRARVSATVRDFVDPMGRPIHGVGLDPVGIGSEFDGDGEVVGGTSRCRALT